MTELPDSPKQPADSSAERQGTEPLQPDPRPDEQPKRLNQVLVWVGIIAGVLFIVVLIFFSGFIVGYATHGCYGGNSGDHSEHMGPGGEHGKGGMTRPGPMGPGQIWPRSLIPTPLRP